MKDGNISGEGVSEEIKEYLHLRKELLTMEVTVKTTRFAAAFILLLSGLIVVMGTLLFMMLAAVSALEPYTGRSMAFIIGGGSYTAVWILIFIFRNTLIVNPLARFIYKVIKT
ncbi:MAG: hypothetical protein RR293_02045 [Bacteroidales bacterium]